MERDLLFVVAYCEWTCWWRLHHSCCAEELPCCVVRKLLCRLLLSVACFLTVLFLLGQSVSNLLRGGEEVLGVLESRLIHESLNMETGCASGVVCGEFLGHEGFILVFGEYSLGWFGR